MKGKALIGRPPLPPGEKRRPSMGFRPTAEVRYKIVAGAEASGRSMSAEIEHRLEMSYRESEWAEEIAAVVRKEVQILKRLLQKRDRPRGKYGM